MDETYLGVIQALGFQFAPRNWAYCLGTIMQISQNEALASLLANNFGGDLRTTFGLPDLRGRAPMGQFQGPGLPNWIIGQTSGQPYVALGPKQLPAHSHLHTYAGNGGGGEMSVAISVATRSGTVQTPSHGDYIGMPGTALAPQGNLYVSQEDVTDTASIGGVYATGDGGAFDNNLFSIEPTGASEAFSIMQPSLVVNYCICTSGLYPSRS